jgi:hypothetical protein
MNLWSSKHAEVSLFEYNSKCLKDCVHFVCWLVSIRFLLDLRFIHINYETERLYRENNCSNLATALWWLVLTSVQRTLCCLDTENCIPHDRQYMKYIVYCCKLTPRHISQTAGLCILNEEVSLKNISNLLPKTCYNRNGLVITVSQGMPSISATVKGLFYSAECPDRAWGPTSLIFKVQRGTFS